MTGVMKQKVCMAAAICIAIAGTLLFSFQRAQEVEAKVGKTQQALAEEVFRFHVVADSDSREDQAVIHNGTAQIIGVSDLEDAARTAKRLEEEGIDCIELCGAFREEGARAVIEATGNRIPVGYVTHLPEQDDVYRKAFAGK